MPDNIHENTIHLYTDGSSYSGPRRGGMGVVIVVIDQNGDEQAFEVTPIGRRSATNQQMELQACIEGLKLLVGKYSPVNLQDYGKILTDSQYVTDNFNNAKFVWPRSKWFTKDGTPVINAEQWKDLVKRSNAIGMKVEIEWVKGHRASSYNRMADKLAKSSAKGVLHEPISVGTVRRKSTLKSVERGSVVLSGQLLTVRILYDEFLKSQRLFRYKYEVLSTGSPYFGNVDIAFSEEEVLLRAGHHYYVRFNADAKNPRILRVFKEIPRRPDKALRS
jgi:ribonuclease HI